MKDWSWIATIQFTPTFKQVERNRLKILKLCQLAVDGQAKLLILPEMCLSGYNFEHRAQVLPLAEAADGISCSAFQTFCHKNQCWLGYGFAEFHQGKLYNSQNLISPKGQLVHTYRKVCLFENDEIWATPGKRFFSLHTEYGKLGLGICMDLNSDQFIQFHKQQKTDLLLFSANWIAQNTDSMNYWKRRLANFSGTACIANRAGQEGDLQFCGLSCIVQNHQILKHADAHNDSVLLTRHGLMAKVS